MPYAAPTPIASGITFAQLQAKGFTGHLETLIAAQVATTRPTVAGTIATGTTYGGLLPAGVYYLNFTETNGFGESLPSAQSSTFTVSQQAAPAATATGAGSSTGGLLPTGTYIAKYTYVDALGGETGVGTSVSAGISVTLGEILTITFADGGLPTGIVSRNLYLTAAGGAHTTVALYATGCTASTKVCTSASWTDGTTTKAAAAAPPTANTTTTNLPVVTFPTIKSGNTARNLYLTAPDGLTGTEVLYTPGITTSTYTMSKLPNIPNPPALPTVAHTALSTNGKMLEFARTEEKRLTTRIFNHVRAVVYDYCRGNPVNQTEALQRFREAHAAIALYNTAMTEIGVLINDNPGHIANVATGIGGLAPKRVWP